MKHTICGKIRVDFICLLCLITVFSAVFCLSGCGERFYTVTKSYYDVFGTNLDILLILGEKDDTATAEKTADELYILLKEIESKISSNSSLYPESDVCRFNDLQQGEEVRISEESAELFSLSKRLYKETDGLFDPSVYYLVEYWGFGNYGSESIPKRSEDFSDEECVNALKNTLDFDSAELIRKEGEFYLKKGGKAVSYMGRELWLKLDFGGIGKGFAVDKARDFLKEKGYTGGYVSLGGSSIALLSNPTDKNGTITVNLINPRADKTGSNYYARVPLKETGIAASGDYEKFFTENGVRYCHIINPQTGFPISGGGITSTVVSENSAMGDALATVLLCMDKTDVLSFIKGEFFLSVTSGYSLVFDVGERYAVNTNLSLTLTDKSFYLE